MSRERRTSFGVPTSFLFFLVNSVGEVNMDNDLANQNSDLYISSKKDKGFFERLLKLDWGLWVVRAAILFSLGFGSFLLASGSFVSGATFLGVAIISYYLLEKNKNDD